MDANCLKNRIIDELKEVIELAEKDVHVEKNLDDIGDEEITKFELFKARLKIVKGFYSVLDDVKLYINEQYGRELRFSKEKYPTAWMLLDEPKRSIGIMQNLDRYPMIFPLLNFLFELTRHVRGEKLKQMKELTVRVTGGKKYVYIDTNGKYVGREFSVFVTDKQFYQKATKRLRYSEIYIKKFIQSLTSCGILIRLGRVGRIGWLYSDGYYTPTNLDMLRKHAFLKKTKDYRQALRHFKPGM